MSSKEGHEMCISQEQYKILFQDIVEIKGNVKQVHDIIYGNGRDGIRADILVLQERMRYMEEKVSEASGTAKGLSKFIRDNLAVLLIGGGLAIMDLVLHFS